MVLINAMFFTAEDAEDAEKGFILGKGAVPMQAMKALTQGFAGRPIMVAPQGDTG